MRRWLNIHQDLGLQLLAFYLLLIVPFLVTLVVFDSIVGERIRQDVEANDLALARAIALETDSSISSSLIAIKNLATYPAVIEMDIAGMTDVFQAMMKSRPDVNLVYRLGPDGIMLFHFPTGPTSTVGTDFSFRGYFQSALTASAPLISEGRISPTTSQAVATAIMPVRSPDGEFLGVVGANIKLESLSETLAAIAAEHSDNEGFDVLILDASGQVIAHPNPDFLLKPADEIIPKVYTDALSGRDGSIITRDLDARERLYTSAAITTIGWGVLISQPTDTAFATRIILERITQVSAATFILIGLAFWGILSVRVIRPIEKLAPISEAIGHNREIENSQRTQIIRLSRRSDQIGHLIRSILRMENSINARIKAQETLIETSATVASSLDLNTVLNRIIEQAGRLLDVNMLAIIALDEKRGEFRIRASRGLSKSFTEQLSLQPNEPSSVSMRALRVREPIEVSDTETDPSYTPQRPRARAEGYRAVLGVPLNTQHAPPTVILVFRPTPHVFTPNEVSLLSSFANQATMAIENAILFERSDMRLKEQTSRLEALVESMDDGLILGNLQGRVIYANRRVTDLTGPDIEPVVNQDVEAVMKRILEKSVEDRSEEFRKIGEGRARRMELALLQSGGKLELRIEAFDVTDTQGHLLGRGLLLHDITLDHELDRMKSNLISTVSHELRTPLAAIKGYASTLLADDVEWDQKSQKEFLAIISNETDRLTALVNNLLDLSRIEAGSLQLSLEECNIVETIERAARQAGLSVPARLEMKIETGMALVQADPTRLETILRNLFENAIKYGGDQVTLTVTVRQKDACIEFLVRDDGPGIPMDQREKIFERFYRLDDSLARITSGAGLGLAICQGLVRAHNGEIWVEPVENGACIAFTIPLDLTVEANE